MTTFPDPSMPPAFEPYQPPPAWVKVIGIISIVLGSLGLVCSCIALAALPLQSQIMSSIPQPAGQAPLQLPPQLAAGPLHYASSVLSVVSSAILLTAGIMLLKHHSLSKTLHLVYAGLAIPITILGIMLQLQQTRAMNEWMQAQGLPSAPGQQMGQTLGMGCGAVFGLAYPVFLLVWFAAMGKKVPPPANPPAA